MIKSILIASNNYPTPTDPQQSFVEQLVIAFAKMGVEVTVIAPYRIVQHWLRHTEIHPKERVIHLNEDENAKITVYQPRYVTLGNRFSRFNEWSARRSVTRMARKLKIKPDVCYGHFWQWALSLYPYAKENNIPLIVATGESRISLNEVRKPAELYDFVQYVKGVVCVSTKNRDESIEKGLTIAEKCDVIPNAIDNQLFHLKDKKQLRFQNGFDENDFIVAFVGWFDENKGVQRVSEAISQIKDASIKSFFIGGHRGGVYIEPKCDGILYKGTIPHNDMPNWLNMADVFVLPTLSEGCCNSIIEAMACGLPIVSSNLPFNWDVLNDKNSIMVDPMNIEEIAAAIKTLKQNRQKREAMAHSAIETAENLTIDKRAKKIIEFIESIK